MNYVNEVAQFFLSRFPDITVLGPEDYTLIAEWEKQEIPLEIIYRTIDETPTEIGDVTAITQFHESIKKNFRDWLQSVTPKN